MVATKYLLLAKVVAVIATSEEIDKKECELPKLLLQCTP